MPINLRTIKSSDSNLNMSWTWVLTLWKTLWHGLIGQIEKEVKIKHEQLGEAEGHIKFSPVDVLGDEE
jgi:hypothetical protein